MRRKKVLITAGIVISILAIVVGVIMIIMGKEEKIECPVTGVKLGMSSEEVEKKLEDKEIEWREGETEGEKQFTTKNIYSDFFETEIRGVFRFSEENKLKGVELFNTSDIVGENNIYEKIKKTEKKITAYYTKKYGNPSVKESEDYYISYCWEKDNWYIWISFSYNDFGFDMFFGWINTV